MKKQLVAGIAIGLLVASSIRKLQGGILDKWLYGSQCHEGSPNTVKEQYERNFGCACYLDSVRRKIKCEECTRHVASRKFEVGY